MKKLFFLAAAAIAFAACSNNQNASTTAAIDINGHWSIVEAMGQATDSAENPTFVVFAGDSLYGNASVNSFMGRYSLEGDQLSLSKIAVTAMMGADMAIEDAVVAALNSVASMSMDGNNAYLCNADHDTVMVLVKD